MRRPKSKSDPTERYGRTKLVVIAAFLILAPSVVLASATAAEGFVTFYAVVALFIVLLPFLLRRRYDLFEPINFVVLNVLIGITLRTIYIAFFAQTQSRWFLMQGRSLAFLQSKFPLILLGLLALTIGYLREGVRVPIEKWVPNISADRWYTNRLAVLLIVLSFVAGVSLFIYMRTMNVPMTLNLFQISSHRHYEVRGASEWAYGGMGYYLWGIQLFKIAFYLQLAYVLRTKKGLFSPAGITALLLGIGALALPIMNNSRQGMS
ncbi:MAG: hypothetical protein ABEL76_10390, partial [Bradymonadaceae bacterium]